MLDVTDSRLFCNLESCSLIGVLAMSDSPKRTSDGFEVHMGINFLGHYALTRRTVGETNLYDKKIIPRGLTTFSGHTRSGLHGNYQISPL